MPRKNKGESQVGGIASPPTLTKENANTSDSHEDGTTSVSSASETSKQESALPSQPNQLQSAPDSQPNQLESAPSPQPNQHECSSGSSVSKDPTGFSTTEMERDLECLEIHAEDFENTNHTPITVTDVTNLDAQIKYLEHDSNHLAKQVAAESYKCNDLWRTRHALQTEIDSKIQHRKKLDEEIAKLNQWKEEANHKRKHQDAILETLKRCKLNPSPKK
jgi:hypothetical protein